MVRVPLDLSELDRAGPKADRVQSSQRLDLVDDLFDQALQVHGTPVHAQDSCIGPGKKKQPLNQPGDPVGLLQGASQDGLIFLRPSGRPQPDLDFPFQNG